MSEQKEKFYLALTNNNSYHWVIFKARPEQANADDTGFIAVGESFDTQQEAEETKKYLNYALFRIE